MLPPKAQRSATKYSKVGNTLTLYELEPSSPGVGTEALKLTPPSGTICPLSPNVAAAGLPMATAAAINNRTRAIVPLGDAAYRRTFTKYSATNPRPAGWG